MELTDGDLYMLLQRDPAAKAYYDTLPRYLQEELGACSGRIDSLSRMQNHVKIFSAP